MNKIYNEPEIKIVKMKGEDILTDSHLEDKTNGWETGSDAPFIPLYTQNRGCKKSLNKKSTAFPPKRQECSLFSDIM